MSRTRKDTITYKKELADKTNNWWGCIGAINSDWKKVRRKVRRAKEKSALIREKEIPIFKQTDEWDWW